MRRTALALAAFLPQIMACTAFGAWLYDDPSFALQAVNLRREYGGQGLADSLELVFVGCNRNDYDLMGEGFVTRLAVDGKTIGEGARVEPVRLVTRDTSRFTVTVPLRDSSFATDRKSRRFEIVAHSDVRTPIGNRPVDLRVRGRVRQGAGENLDWYAETNPLCRPGLSQLPASFDPRASEPIKPLLRTIPPGPSLYPSERN
jgi:hypothetical protein